MDEFVVIEEAGSIDSETETAYLNKIMGDEE